MPSRKKVAALCLALAALSGCGNSGQDEGLLSSLGQLKTIAKEIATRKDPKTPAPDPNTLVANVIRELPGVPLQAIQRGENGPFAIASLYGQNRGVITWITRERSSVSYDGPMLTATRGLGNDLMSVKDGGAVRLIAARQAGTVIKEYRFLNGEDETGKFRVTCRIAPGETAHVQNGMIYVSARVVRETCEQGTFKTTNTYWVDGAGRAVQSVQWAGPRNGHIISRRIQ